MNSEYTYYVPWPLNGRPPSVVFKVYGGEGKLPERYVARKGWIEDYRILFGFMNGDLGPPDIVTEERALSIIDELEKRK